MKHKDMLHGSLHGDMLHKILVDNIMPAVLCECTLHLLPHAVGVLMAPGAIHTGHYHIWYYTTNITTNCLI